MNNDEAKLAVKRLLISDNNRKKPNMTFKRPKNSILDKVKNFLPQLEESNRQLEKEIAEKGIDAVKVEMNTEDEGDNKLAIEMNLGVGVFDVLDDEKNDKKNIKISPNEIQKSTDEFLGLQRDQVDTKKNSLIQPITSKDEI